MFGALSWVHCQFATLMPSPLAAFPSSSSAELTAYSYARRKAFARCCHWQKTQVPAISWRPSLPRVLCPPNPGIRERHTINHESCKVFVVQIKVFLLLGEELSFLLFEGSMGTPKRAQWGALALCAWWGRRPPGTHKVVDCGTWSLLACSLRFPSAE
jgi:hypothetical protein